MASPANALAESGKLVGMAARQSPSNNHLVEAMALLIRNQAAFVEQISRSDQERLALQIKSEEWQRKSDEWQRKSDERFARIEAQLVQLPAKVIQTVLDQFPRLKKEIGFNSPK